ETAKQRNSETAKQRNSETKGYNHLVLLVFFFIPFISIKPTDKTENTLESYKEKYYSYKADADPKKNNANAYKNIFNLSREIDTRLDSLEKNEPSDDERALIIELGALSNKVRLDLKRFELASDSEAQKKDVQLRCEEENNSAAYMGERYRPFNSVFKFLGSKLTSCNIGILPVSITAIYGRGKDEYVDKASFNPWGMVSIEEGRSKKNYLFYSNTLYIRFNPIYGLKFFVGPTVGIGVGTDSKFSSQNPVLMYGPTVGITLDDTKFFAVTYGFISDPNTHILPDYLRKNIQASYLKINDAGTVDSWLKNKEISIPLKNVIGHYQGIGFTFSYKF
ncbi:MAG TPA: hypothetical protein PKA14_17990, partial [Leptospiraceae bacterium]|nr:hypothetical protein [Leptospiraceae bacterium]